MFVETVWFTHSSSNTAIWLKLPRRSGTNDPSEVFVDWEVVVEVVHDSVVVVAALLAAEVVVV